MKKIVTAAIAGAAMVATVGVADAATCTTKYLTGVWVGTANEDDDSYCIVQFRQNGWVVQASCFDSDTLKSIGTWNGRFTSDKACNVSGNFDFIPKRGKKVDILFKGTLNPNTGIMKGTLTPKAGGGSEKYTLVEQWN